MSLFSHLPIPGLPGFTVLFLEDMLRSREMGIKRSFATYLSEGEHVQGPELEMLGFDIWVTTVLYHRPTL